MCARPSSSVIFIDKLHEIFGDSSLISTIEYSTHGSIAVENTNDAREVACDKPEAQAKPIVPPNVDNGLTMDLEIKIVGLNIYE